ncbi:MAG: amidohydrolase family protein [Phycisphaeraceae bacterium]
MQNIHSHVWDQQQHIEPATVREADLSRGRPLDLSVGLEAALREAERFDKVAVFGLKGRRTGYWVPDAFVAELVAQAGQKLVGFACCDPTDAAYMDELTEAVEHLKLRGLKMGPIYGGFDARDERCDPVYDYCQRRGLPILFHTGTTFNRLAPLRYAYADAFDDVAMRYPELRMVLAHLGHPFHEQCICVIRKHPHVYADISALHYRPWQFYNMMMLAQEYRVTHKLLLGTDYPFAGADETIRGLEQVNDITGASGLPRVTDETIQGILHRDAFGLLGIDG